MGPIAILFKYRLTFKCHRQEDKIFFNFLELLVQSLNSCLLILMTLV